MVRAVVDQLLRHGEVRRGEIGLQVQDLTPELAHTLRVDAVQGVVVAQVAQGSAAARAGLRTGDIVTAVGGVPVRSAADFNNRVGLAETGSDLAVTYQRGKQRRTATVRVEAGSNAAVQVSVLSGATFTDIPQDHPAYGQIDGALVARVERGSTAAVYGLRPGDLIIGVNGEPIASAAELRERLGRRESRLALNLLRGGRQLLLMIE
jgi:S1-C subfamily serine protease